MNTQHKKNQLTIIVIFAMSIIPFGIAWYYASHPDLLTLGKSNGDLITPPVTTQYSDFSGYDAFTSAHLQELPGHWVLLNLVPQDNCTENCVDALHKTKQISLMLGKDISRVRTAAIVLNPAATQVFNQEWQDDGHLLKLFIAKAMQEKMQFAPNNPALEGMLLIMDPLGNLMMKYPAGYDPYKVKSDLSRLLRISQIG